MSILRFLAIVCMKRNITVKARHLPGKNNLICDAISRFQNQRFRTLAPDADEHPTEIPSYLWTVLDNELEVLYLQAFP